MDYVSPVSMLINKGFVYFQINTLKDNECMVDLIDCGSLGSDALIVIKESLGDDMAEEEDDRKWGKTRKRR